MPRQLQPAGAANPIRGDVENDWWDRISWFPAKNISGEEIPTYGLVRVTGVTSDGQLEVQKPNTDGQDVWIAGDGAFINGGFSAITRQAMYARYETADGTPANGETWGAGNGSFKLRKGNSGFTVIGNPVNETVLVAPERGGGADGDTYFDHTEFMVYLASGAQSVNTTSWEDVDFGTTLYEDDPYSLITLNSGNTATIMVADATYNYHWHFAAGFVASNADLDGDAPSIRIRFYDTDASKGFGYDYKTFTDETDPFDSEVGIFSSAYIRTSCPHSPHQWATSVSYPITSEIKVQSLLPQGASGSSISWGVSGEYRTFFMGYVTGRTPR